MMHNFEDIHWWHSIVLPDGRITPGAKSIEDMQREFNETFTDIDLQGKTVLDIGASSGGFSIEAFKRGARRVVAVDHVDESITNGKAFTDDNHYYRKALLSNTHAIEYAAKAFNVPLEIVNFNIDDPSMSMKHFGEFDITLFLGIFYHLVDPIAALREACAITKEVIVIETHMDNESDHRPSMIFYPNEELNNDPTNWWGPNAPLMYALLNQFGFKNIQYKSKWANRGIFHAWRNND